MFEKKVAEPIKWFMPKLVFGKFEHFPASKFKFSFV